MKANKKRQKGNAPVPARITKRRTQSQTTRKDVDTLIESLENHKKWYNEDPMYRRIIDRLAEELNRRLANPEPEVNPKCMPCSGDPDAWLSFSGK
jgi:hypothetical protein